MPFTPFHMGAALLVKPIAGKRFSVLVFGVSQVVIDLEPLVRIIRGDAELHGWTHTLAGAFALGVVAAFLARAPVNWWLGRLRAADVQHKLPPLLTGDVPWLVAFVSAWIGTGSHLLLDGLMHADMSPFAPLTSANPLLGMVSLDVLQVGCVLGGALGLALLALRARMANSGEA